MARQVVVLVLMMIGIGVLCATQAPVAAKRAPAKRTRSAEKPPAKAALPGPVNKRSLGFGSIREDVLRLMGKPARIAKVANREVWFYGLSTISLAGGKKVVAWSKYDRALPVNIGRAKPDAPRITAGSSVRAVVAARGTPDTVALLGQYQVWFFGTRSYAIYNGKVVPERTAGQTAGVIQSSAASHRPKCWCPL